MVKLNQQCHPFLKIVWPALHVKRKKFVKEHRKVHYYYNDISLHLFYLSTDVTRHSCQLIAEGHLETGTGGTHHFDSELGGDFGPIFQHAPDEDNDPDEDIDPNEDDSVDKRTEEIISRFVFEVLFLFMPTEVLPACVLAINMINVHGKVATPSSCCIDHSNAHSFISISHLKSDIDSMDIDRSESTLGQHVFQIDILGL